MLRKFFIFAFLSVSSAVFAGNSSLIDNLIIPDTIRVCREDTIRFQLTDPTLLEATDTSLLFEWTSTHEWHDTTTNPFFAIPSFDINVADITGRIWIKITDTVNNTTRYDTIFIEPFPFPDITRARLEIDTTLCFGDTLFLSIEMDSVFNATFTGWGISVGTAPFYSTQTTLLVPFDSARLMQPENLNFIAVFTGYCTRFPLDYLMGGPYRDFDTVSIFFARPPEIEFRLNNVPVNIDTIFCFDGEVGLTAFDDEFSQFKFRWLRNNDTVGRGSTLTIDYDDQGKQIVKIWNEVCWIDREMEEYFATDSVEIRFWPQAWTNAHILLQDTSVCDRIRVTLDATAENLDGLTTYHWSGSGIDTNDIDNPIRIVLPGNFMVILRDTAGCEREFSVNVGIENCDPSLEMPNVFTPNGDGVNDYFRPTTLHRVYNFHLRIYNRQGRMVYEFGPVRDFPSEQDWQGWDGRNRGTDAPEGVYFWAVRYDDIWGRIHREQGTVTILR